MLANCHIWSVVDFGNGPVEIRCTELGEHEDHRCEVFIEVDEPEKPLGDVDVEHRNIFDGSQDLQPL